jgi:hypothetical protein
MDHDDQSLGDFGVADANFSRSILTQTFSIPLPGSDADPLTLISVPDAETVAPVRGYVMLSLGLAVSGAAAAGRAIWLPAGYTTAEKMMSDRMNATATVLK